MLWKHFFIKHFADVASNNILFEAILWNCILTQHSFAATFRSCIPTLSFFRQFYGIVFSKHFLWGNSTKLYFQNISFKTTLQSRIIQKSLWGNSTELYSQNIHYKITFRSCIPTFCFKATLRRCISTILLWSNSIELYSQKISFKTTLRSCIFLKHFLWDNSAELYSQNTFF